MYECTSNNREELESIQQKILERIRDLRDQDLPLSEDTALTSYYKMNAEIQNCILNDHTFGPTTLGLVIEKDTTFEKNSRSNCITSLLL